MSNAAGPSLFQRFLLPGLAFKAVVIGGGYATGRELAEFFFPAGPAGGLLGLLLAMGVWSLVCAVTFLFARATHSDDYRVFFRHLLGPFWPAFEFAYVCFLFLILSVFGAAAGEIGAAVFGLPLWAGSVFLAAGILFFAALGTDTIERLFKYASIFLYSVYVIFVAMSFSQFGGDIIDTLNGAAINGAWFSGGLTYAGYNVVGAVIILPILRHLTCNRDAVTAGLLAGPLAMLPAILFFLCMLAFYPQIGGEALPSNYILERLGSPVFQIAFQFMIFVALLETSVSAVHAVNERIDGVTRRPLGHGARLAIAAVIVVFAMFLAQRFGLIDLIAKGYRALAYMILLTYVLPLLTLGVWKLWRWSKRGKAANPAQDSAKS